MDSVKSFDFSNAEKISLTLNVTIDGQDHTYEFFDLTKASAYSSAVMQIRVEQDDIEIFSDQIGKAVWAAEPRMLLSLALGEMLLRGDKKGTFKLGPEPELYAKYDGVCGDCGLDILEGMPIRKSKKTKNGFKWKHADCANAMVDSL